MRNSYPIVLTPCADGYTVFIPDFNTGTQGDDMTEAIEMARDAIGLMGIDMEDDNKPLPAPSAPGSIQKADSDLITYVDVDFTDYRRKNDSRLVRRNCSLPSWLDYRAETAGLDLSQVLQKALMRELHITSRQH